MKNKTQRDRSLKEKIKGLPPTLPEICEYCGWKLGYCHLGDYCTNPKCGYVDGMYLK